MTKILVILVFALCVEAVGVVFLSKGLKQIGEVQSISARESDVSSSRARPIQACCWCVLEAAFFGALLYLLSQRDVSLIWPLTRSASSSRARGKVCFEGRSDGVALGGHFVDRYRRFTRQLQ